MRKWVRWRGLLAFVVAAAALAGLWYLFLDTWVERGIEKAGTRLVGAMVELESADVSLFPAGLTLRGLKVTNPDRPMRNAVEAGRIALTLDASQLVQRKVIIEEMSVTGVLFDTPRKTSGALRKKEKKKEEKKAFLLPSFELPSVEEIIEKEDIRSVELARSLEKEIEQQKRLWRQRVEELPDREKFRAYEKRIKGLKTGGGLEGALDAAREARGIRQDIQSDMARIREARDGIVKTRKSLSERLDEARQTVERDFARIRAKYGSPANAFASATRLLAGEKASSRVEKAILWYRKLRPPVERAAQRRKAREARPPRGEGVDVRFPEEPPVPEFLIRKAVVGAALKGIAVTGTVANITTEQELTGVPLTFDFEGKESERARDIRLSGKLDRVGEVDDDTLRIVAKGYGITNASFEESAGFPLSLQSGVADFSLDARVRGGKLRAMLAGTVKSAKFSLSLKEDADRVLRSLASALEGVERFSFELSVNGTLDDYSLGISSDLDRVLRDAVGRVFREQAALWEARLRSGITERADIGQLGERLGELGMLEEELKSRIGSLEGLLKETAMGKGTPSLPFRGR